MILTFDVSKLPLWQQNVLLDHLDLQGFGIAQEGRYVSLTPPRLVERIERATFVFEWEGEIDTALRIAGLYGARLISVR